jgi:hypothetical protein
MAGVGQVIYLTHHRHLCEIARESFTECGQPRAVGFGFSLMRQRTRSKNNKTSGGGKATASGVSFQAEVAAWLAVHILAGKPLRDVYGIPINSIAQSIRQESAHPVDDIFA